MNHRISPKMAQALSTSSSQCRGRGRPPKEINLDDAKYLLSLGISRAKVADIQGVTRQTLYNRIKGCSNPEAFNRYSDLSDAHLDSLIRSIKQSHPNDGEVMVAGHLLSRGVHVSRVRLRASIHRVDPEGVAERRSTAIKRRSYHVSRPNDVWHIDGHHKLIRWRLVVHGGIDGYSRTITFLRCHINNRASTVLSAFREGVEKYGLPTKVRTDHGGENIEVWRMMLDEHEAGESCVIAGSSTHNERFERLWRDVHRSVIVTFGNLFRALEAEGHYDHRNEVDIYCLHYVFVPRINQALSSFVEGWNSHAVSTEGNQTPHQMFIMGLLPSSSNSDSDSDSDSEEGSEAFDLQSNDAVSVPRCSFDPCSQLLQELTNSVDPCLLVVTMEGRYSLSQLEFVVTT